MHMDMDMDMYMHMSMDMYSAVHVCALTVLGGDVNGRSIKLEGACNVERRPEADLWRSRAYPICRRTA